MQCLAVDILIKDQVWSKVQHGAISERVRPPSQGKYHHPHPRRLDHEHLVVHVQVAETCPGEGGDQSPDHSFYVYYYITTVDEKIILHSLNKDMVGMKCELVFLLLYT